MTDEGASSLTLVATHMPFFILCPFGNKPDMRAAHTNLKASTATQRCCNRHVVRLYVWGFPISFLGKRRSFLVRRGLLTGATRGLRGRPAATVAVFFGRI